MNSAIFVVHANQNQIINYFPVYDENGHEIGLRFLVVSDWGGIPAAPYKTDAQVKVAQGMAELADRYDASFFLSLGDNFKDKGVSTVNDSRFEVRLLLDGVVEPFFASPSCERYGNSLADSSAES